MGTVYEADDLSKETNAKRALKLLRQEFVHDERVVRRFLSEAVAVRALNHHPNVAQVLEADASEDRGTPYLVMKLSAALRYRSTLNMATSSPPNKRCSSSWPC